MPFYKPKRASRYWQLRHLHFVPAEAREFSSLSRKYPALRKMAKQRAGMWLLFNRRMGREGIESPRKQIVEWRKAIKQWYEQRGWIVTKTARGRTVKPRPSPWEWYDSVFQKLPLKDKRDTPRSHRKRITDPVLKMDKIMKRRWMADLNKSIRDAETPERKAELMEQRKRLMRS